MTPDPFRERDLLNHDLAADVLSDGVNVQITMSLSEFNQMLEELGAEKVATDPPAWADKIMERLQDAESALEDAESALGDAASALRSADNRVFAQIEEHQARAT